MADDEGKPLLDVMERTPTSSSHGVPAKEEPKKYSPICDPSHLAHRLWFLFLICFLSFGNYFVYDNPAALQNQFEKDMDISTAKFMLMYALYSWPNVALCFFGGFFMDKIIGLRWGAILFAAFVLIGQVIVALGASIGSYTLVLVGRFVFGLGGENLSVAQNTYAVSWFQGKELNLVFGLQLSISRLGSTVNMLTMSVIYNKFADGKDSHQALGGALWIGAGLCLFSLLCAFAAAYYDKRAARILHKQDSIIGDDIKITHVLNFPASFWLICIICVCFYVTIFPFIGLATLFFQSKYGVSQEIAATINSVVYLISAGASPLFGFCVDLFGRNVLWVTVGVVITLGCHMMMTYSFISPFVPMIIMGFSYSILASALWPMVAFMVPSNYLGTAYGFMQAVQNLGLAVIAMVAGMIQDDKGYFWLELFFCMFLAAALLCSVLLYIVNDIQGGILNMSPAQRAAVALKDKEASDLAKLESVKEPTPADILRRRSNFDLRNRLMSRLDFKIPDHLGPSKLIHSGPGIFK